MKKYCLLLITATLFCGFLVSCGSKKKSREERIEEFRSELTAEDTAAMLKLCDDAMADLKAHKVDQVLANL